MKNKSPEDFLKLITEESRGKLKIILGFAAGVGKTYNMLAEGHHLKDKKVNVVIGYLEPHDRVETIKKASGLEVIPPLIFNYAGLVLKEMDVDAIIKRHPTVALADELAHTNAPGSKNQKRYQDVEELLEAGINVITTLNIQHLESLYNIVEEATGVKVSERIPDKIVANANLIVNVDLEAEELIERLKSGKVYKSEMIEAALNNFFTAKNLTSLREIALSETANLLDNRRCEKKTELAPLNTLNKIMVVLNDNISDSTSLLRKGYRMATHLNPEWYAVYLLDEKNKFYSDREFEKMLEFAKKMGANIIEIQEKNALPELIKLVKNNNVTHLIVGRPTTNMIKDLFKKSYLEKILDSLPDIDILIG